MFPRSSLDPSKADFRKMLSRISNQKSISKIHCTKILTGKPLDRLEGTASGSSYRLGPEAVFVKLLKALNLHGHGVIIT